ncbi:phosphohydrolase [Azospirillum sp. Sh1]|uniref:phosphohydrolase n=1 Tax=Azospirillum sp. Sh1 TaxID=2607285 RepID=UPI0011EFECFE|nr:phosphohydrolase [Azospirillum sp. Sh1]KAA0573466.1 phosphohydrolase [Azospirillum sp. Sh1]
MDGLLDTRTGSFVTTVSGRRFFPLDPRVEDICINDIAHSLARQCRYNGHVRAGHYSVAEHSVLCSLVVDEEIALQALLHDAAEAYIGDLVRPMKVLPELRAVWTPIEEGVERVISERFGLPFPWHPDVKRADNAVLAREILEIRPATPWAHECAELPADVEVTGWQPGYAEWKFLKRFNELCRP